MKKILFLFALAIGMMAFAGEPVKTETTQEGNSVEVKGGNNGIYNQTESDFPPPMCCRSVEDCDGNDHPVCVIGKEGDNQADLCKQAQKSALLEALANCQ